MNCVECGAGHNPMASDSKGAAWCGVVFMGYKKLFGRLYLYEYLEAQWP